MVRINVPGHFASNAYTATTIPLLHRPVGAAHKCCYRGEIHAGEGLWLVSADEYGGKDGA
jgi:hypothetical protein